MVDRSSWLQRSPRRTPTLIDHQGARTPPLAAGADRLPARAEPGHCASGPGPLPLPPAGVPNVFATPAICTPPNVTLPATLTPFRVPGRLSIAPAWTLPNMADGRGVRLPEGRPAWPAGSGRRRGRQLDGLPGHRHVARFVAARTVSSSR